MVAHFCALSRDPSAQLRKVRVLIAVEEGVRYVQTRKIWRRSSSKMVIVDDRVIFSLYCVRFGLVCSANSSCHDMTNSPMRVDKHDLDKFSVVELQLKFHVNLFECFVVPKKTFDLLLAHAPSNFFCFRPVCTPCPWLVVCSGSMVAFALLHATGSGGRKLVILKRVHSLPDHCN